MIMEVFATPLLALVFATWSWITDRDIKNHFKIK
jgi:hypothetical protein